MNSPWAVHIDENVGWFRIDYNHPELIPKKQVLTKIDDHKGARNVWPLRYSDGLWWSEGGMYVYYTPTHWKPMP